MALPTGYTQLEYIQSNGSAYIDTGLTVNKSDSWELIFDAHLVSSTNWGGANGYLQYLQLLGLLIPEQMLNQAFLNQEMLIMPGILVMRNRVNYIHIKFIKVMF